VIQHLVAEVKPMNSRRLLLSAKRQSIRFTADHVALANQTSPKIDARRDPSPPIHRLVEALAKLLGFAVQPYTARTLFTFEYNGCDASLLISSAVACSSRCFDFRRHPGRLV
jgi:hypothetical protein